MLHLFLIKKFLKRELQISYLLKIIKYLLPQQIIMKDGIAHVYEILQFYKLSHITSTLLQQKMCVTLNVDNKTQKKKTKTYL